MTSHSWSAGRTAHQGALTAFVARARALPQERWNRPDRPEAWTPAQIAEHLRMTYQIVTAELEGGAGLRLRSPAWMRPFLRLLILRRILKSGAIPARARAPREARPADGPYDRDELLRALETAAARFERALESRWNDRGPVVTHHIFGRFNAPDAFRFVTVHIDHHTRQVPEITR